MLFFLYNIYHFNMQDFSITKVPGIRSHINSKSHIACKLWIK